MAQNPMTDEEFKKLRNAVTGHLVEIGRGQADSSASQNDDALPDLEPAPLGAWASRAFV